MVRKIAFLIGLGFIAVLLIGLVSTIIDAVRTPAPESASHEFHLEPRPAGFSSDGVFGKWDRAQLQRGFQVYKEVCAGCHSMRLVSFRDLEQIGYNEAEVKAIAQQWPVEQPSINEETGEPATRKNLPSDRIPSPYANEVAARAANNNALPPDLSLMVKARDDGTDYIHSLLTGYREQPAEVVAKFPDAKTPDGLHYNPYYANLNIAMPPPLASDGQVTYSDGTKSTVDQMARDVAAFLTWTAEPNLERRHAAGLAAVLFIVIFCFLAYGAYKNVWADMKH
ncbi:MAG TPA: cytochrome c1 [Sphingomonas sp.]|jgi:ubiquinol-cytochrome c reductase cytochrome c1 subunit|uniref:cytochrome c1 n=1 Tax=Sphingomonas sp. TaxID=28214 RepID=UPI002EDA8E0B